jgi:hypothetical protein
MAERATNPGFFVPSDQPLIGVIVREDGHEVI